jgi:hypothetical protein
MYRMYRLLQRGHHDLAEQLKRALISTVELFGHRLVSGQHSYCPLAAAGRARSMLTTRFLGWGGVLLS